MAVHPSLKRVVITGIGAVTPFGKGAGRLWESVIANRSAITSIPDSYPDTGASYKDIPSKIAGMVPRGSESWQVSEKRDRAMGRFAQYAMIAADEALADSKWTPSTDEESERTGVCFGSSIGCLDEVESASAVCNQQGFRRISPYFVPKVLINIPAGRIAIEHNLRGPNHSASTACATGAHSIGDAARLIQFGDADVVVAGASESCVSPLVMAGFAKAKALSTEFNSTPEAASRPFSSDRDGFVIGEGSGAVVVESLDHAIKRGAHIYAEVLGYGLSCDANHITMPPADGRGALAAMKSALRHGSITAAELDYINAHATSTPAGDLAENTAIERLLGDSKKDGFMISATKSSTGHLLGAAGVVESIMTILAIKNNVVPPTLNFDGKDPAFKFDYVPHKSRDVSSINGGKGIQYALNNSFGFGGTNASLLFGRFNN